MKKQIKGKRILMMAIIMLAILTLAGANKSHQLNKIKVENNQIRETAVDTDDVTAIKSDVTTEETTSIQKIESMPTEEPSPITTQELPTIISSPNTVVKDQQTEEPPVIDESKGNEYISEDDLIYSNKYIVTIDTIERIAPKTTIEEFLSNITITEGNTVKILKEEEEITTGYVATGMKLQGSSGKTYEISVVGDLSGDGIINQIELTMLVRYVVGQDGSDLEGIYYSAGDITGDGEINIVDVSKMINYIVYEKWDYEEFENPNAPTIKITGETNETGSYYKDKVKVQIIEDKTTENSKTAYKIIGAKTKEETIIGEEEIITIEGEGTYLITAYTYGIRGNRSKGSNKIIKIKKDETYKITLDNQSATEKGSEEVFERYDKGIYKEENLQKQITTTENPIELPRRLYTINYSVEGMESQDIIYTFGGYYTEVNGNGEQLIDESGYITRNFTNTKFDEEATLYAKWTGGIIEKLPIPEKEGIEFIGWYEDVELTKPVEEPFAPTGSKTEITLYPKWTATLKITLDNKNATEKGSKEIFERYNQGIYKEESLQTEMTPTKNPIEKPERSYTIIYNFDGQTMAQDVTYVFGGYYTEENGSGEQIIDEFGFITSNFTNTKFNQETTLYAKWTGGTIQKLATIEKEGIEFIGWYEDVELTKPVIVPFDPTGLEKEINLYPKWTATYKITLDNQSATVKGSEEIYERFNVGIYKEGSLQTEMTTSQNSITVPQRSYEITYKLEEEKTENVTYIFGGYYTQTAGNGEQIIDENGYITDNFTNTKFNQETTLYAKWTGKIIEKLPIPEKEGFEFAGWYEDKELTNPAKEPYILTGVDSKINLYPKWEATLKITLDNQSATTRGSEEIYERYNKGIYREENLETEMTTSQNPIKLPKREYIIRYHLGEQKVTQEDVIYVFGGYYTEENGSGEQIIDEFGYITSNFTNTKFNGETTLYAKWTGGLEAKLLVPEKEGFEFLGWYEDKEFTKPAKEPFDPITSDSEIDLYAKWTATFKVNLDNQSATTKGSEAIFERFNIGIYKEENLQTEITTNENPIIVPQRSYKITYKLKEEKTANITYIFEGYYTEENGNGEQLIDKNGFITGNFKNNKYNKQATLYAKWKLGTIENLLIPEKEGFEFVGWYEDEELTKPIEEPFNPTSIDSDITLYPKWRATLKITLDGQNATTRGSEEIYERYNEGIYKEESLETEMTANKNPIQKPERLYTITYKAEEEITINTTYTFGGYYTEVNGNGEQIINQNGYITENFTSTKFDKEATIYAKWTGGLIQELPTPEKEGYEFEGWYEDEELTKPVKVPFDPATSETNITLYPKWGATFKVNLDDQSATEKGSGEIFERYNSGIYKEESLQTEITIDENPIIVPQRSYEITYKLEEETTVNVTYTFGGYYTEENGNGNQLIDEYGYITRNFTNTKFNQESTIYAKWTGGIIEELPTPEKEGFEFEGWYEDVELAKPVEEPFSPTGLKKEINLYPKWGATFKITLDDQSATEKGRKEIFERYNSGVYKEESLQTKMTIDENPIEKPERLYKITFNFEGQKMVRNVTYVFGGYYTQKDGNGEQLIDKNGYITENFTNTKFNGETILYAKWTGGLIEELPIPEKEGYEFVGWCEDEELTRPVEEPYAPTGANSEINLYPKWTATFKINLDNQNATTKGSEEVFERFNIGIYKDEGLETEITTNENPIIVPQRSYEITYKLEEERTVNITYIFGGYYTEENGNGEQLINRNGSLTENFTNTKFDKEATLYAKWTEGAIEKLPTPEKEGFEFGGWYEDEELENPVEEPFDPETTETEITLYPKWEATFKVNLDDQSATVKGSEAIFERYNQGLYKEESLQTEITANKNPIQKPERVYTITYKLEDGETTVNTTYTFGGYYTEKNGNGEQLINRNGYLTENFTNTKFDKEATIYAKWTGGTIEKLPVPEKEGYDFEGWFEDEDLEKPVKEPYDPISTDSDITLYPKWGATFKIILNDKNATQKGRGEIFERYNSGVYKEESLQTEITIDENPIIVPQRNYEITYNPNGGLLGVTTQNMNYNFEGYYEEEDGSGKQLINEYGYITRNFTKTKFNEETTLYAKWTGGIIEKLPIPEREGFEFEGWYEDEELTRPVEEPFDPIVTETQINLYAKWGATFKITLNNENATKKGNEEIFESYGNGIYKEENLQTEMTIDENPIEKPERIYTIKYYVAGKQITELAQEVIYKFDGYYTEENGSGEQIIDKNGFITENFTNTKFEKDQMLYVKWEGGLVEKLPIPVKKGYEFLGWYKDEEFKIPLEEPYNPVGVNSEIIIYPKFTATFKVNLDNENATEKGSEEVFERFNIGIFKEENLQTEMTTNENPIIVPQRNYEVIYNLNGGTQEITTQNTTCNFEGYYTEEDGNGEQLINKNGYITENFKNNKYEEEKTLHVKWSGGAIEKLPTPSRRGYEFICWCEDEELTKPIEDSYTPVGINREVNLYAKWSDPIPYTISYNLNGGELEEENPTTYTVETETIHLNKPIRADYTFLGWIGSNGETPQTEVTIEKGSIENKEYLAVWQENVCEILLDNAKATIPGSTVVYQAYKQGIYKEEDCITQITTSQNPITIPQRNYVVTYNANGGTLGATTQNATYTFDGYYTQEDGRGIQLITSNGYINSNFTTSRFRQSTTIHANWTGGEITLPTPTREGHTFAGWYTDSGLTTLLGTSGARYTPTEDLTLYAKWNINSYTVTYNGVANGGAGTQTKKVQYEGAIDLTPTATKSGYTFVGWNTDKDAEVALSTLTMGAKDITLYAIYKKTVTLTFVDYNGTTKTTRKEEINIYNNNEGSLTAPAINTYTDWTAKYWTNQTTTIATGINVGEDITNIRANATYYAVYEQEVTGTFKYYNAQQKTVSAKRLVNSYNVGLATSGVINAPGGLGAPTGYTFRGWSTLDTANVSNPLSATAQITLKSNATYYASYQTTVTAKFYYASSTTSMSQTYAESEGVKYINYIGTTVNSNISIPQVVTSSKGPNNTTYVGISTKTNSDESAKTPTTENTNYYAYYEQDITYYYYNGSAHTSTKGKRYARTNGGRYAYSTSTAPSPSAYDSATFKGWSTSSVEVKTPGDTLPTTLYAYYQKSVEATFYYYNGSSSTSTKASGTRTYISKSGGVTTLQGDITVPSIVMQAIEEFTYKGLNATSTLSETIYYDATTEKTKYYAVYSRKMYVIYNANGGTGGVSSPVGDAYMNYKGEVESGNITVGQNMCTKEGYIFRKWNTKANGTGTSYNVRDTIRNVSFKTDITLYAIWEYKIVCEEGFTCEASAEGGGSSNSKSFYIPEDYTIYYSLSVTGTKGGSGTAKIDFKQDDKTIEIAETNGSKSGNYKIPEGGGVIVMNAAGGAPDASVPNGPGSFNSRVTITKILRPDGSVYPLT